MDCFGGPSIIFTNQIVFPIPLFILQRDRRKLHIEPLHLPPEGVRALTEDVEKGRKKKGHQPSTVAMRCATSGRGAAGGGGEGGLDF